MKPESKNSLKPSINEKMYGTRAVNEMRLSAIKENAGSTILDVGCGSGAYVLSLKESLDIKGTDYCAYETWGEEPGRFFVADAAEIAVEDKSFETILSFETLEHLSNPEKALKEYYRICSRNVILTVPNCDITAGLKKSNLIFGHWKDPTHVNFFTLKSICDTVVSAGFTVKKAYYINKINVWPFLFESLGVNPTVGVGAFLVKVFSRIPTRSYYLTCCVIAEK